MRSKNRAGRESFVIQRVISYADTWVERDDQGSMNDNLTIPQSAVLGYRIVGEEAEILLVTSRTRGRWVLPKGMITAGMTPADSAVKEAWEEAGVAGNVSRGCLGVYHYMKTRRCGVRSCAVKVYAMKVTALLPRWPEQRMRKRRWMSIDEAICRVMDRDLKRLLIAFRARMHPRSVAFGGAGPQVRSDHGCGPRSALCGNATISLHGGGCKGRRAKAQGVLPKRHG